MKYNLESRKKGTSFLYYMKESYLDWSNVA